MSAISSFALECARSGRWVRALMALQGGHVDSTDASIRLACVAVAQVAAPHSWEAALTLLRPTDVLQHSAEVCKTIDLVSRHPQLHLERYESAVESLLKEVGAASRRGSVAVHPTRAAHTDLPNMLTAEATSNSSTLGATSLSTSSATTQLQRNIFLSATQWCSWETASRFLAALPPETPAMQTCAERVRCLRTLRHCVLHDVGPLALWCADETAAAGIAGKAGDHRNRTRRHQGEEPSRPGASPCTSTSRTLGSTTEVQSVREQLQRLELALASMNTQHSFPQRNYTARDRRELARLNEKKRQALLQRVQAEEETQVRRAITSVAPAVEDVCAALRVMTRPKAAAASSQAHSHYQDSAMKSILQLAQSSRLTPELALLYARAVGLVCPQQWAEALAVLGGAEAHPQNERSEALQLERGQCLVNLWLMSRGSWTATLRELAQWPRKSASAAQLAVDTVTRTAMPSSVVHRLFPQQVRPWCRLFANSSESLTRQIATALASGVRLDEIQLSVAGKQWAAQGQWMKALQLYHRFPLSEFQKYAARSLVQARPALPMAATSATTGRGEEDVSDSHSDNAFSVMGALRVLVPAAGIQYAPGTSTRPAPPLDVFPACLLVNSAPNWTSAREVFRGCIRTGTRCTPQLLSALLRHTDWPPAELLQVLRSYPTAINDGVRRRAKEAFSIELP